jgi:hypothetical protein
MATPSPDSGEIPTAAHRQSSIARPPHRACVASQPMCGRGSAPSQVICVGERACCASGCLSLRAATRSNLNLVLSRRRGVLHPPAMFLVTEADAAAIGAVPNQEGELSAAIEVRRLFPGITDNAKARAYARPSPDGSRGPCRRFPLRGCMVDRNEGKCEPHWDGRRR